MNFCPGIVAPARIFSVAEKFHPQKECFSRTNVLFCAGYVGISRQDCCCGRFCAGFSVVFRSDFVCRWIGAGFGVSFTRGLLRQ